MLRNSAIISPASLKSGIGTYAQNLFNWGLFEKLVFFESSKTQSSLGYKESIISPVKLRPLQYTHVLVSFYFPTRWSRYIEKLNIVHFVTFDWFHLVKHVKKAFGTIHDLIPLDSFSINSLYFKKEIRYATLLNKIFVCSDAVKKALYELYPDLNHIVRIHSWSEEDFCPRDKLTARKFLDLPLDKKIVLNVSSDSPRKNVDLLIPLMYRLGKDYLLLRIGDSDRIKDRFERKNAIFLNNVPRKILPFYYNAADVLVAPSFKEGFNYPIIEAINSGISVVASDIEVHREVMRNKKYLVHPLDIDAWVESVMRATEEKPDWSDIGDYYKPNRAKQEYQKAYFDAQ